jgi:hypothetical protein
MLEASILLVMLGGHLKQLLEVSAASMSNSYDVDVPGQYGCPHSQSDAKLKSMQTRGAYSVATRQPEGLDADG